MHDLLTNPLIIIAVVSVITNIGQAIAAVANYINARTNMIKLDLQIQSLQQQQTHLATLQQTNSAPTTVIVPAVGSPQVVSGPTGPMGATVAPGGPYSVR